MSLMIASLGSCPLPVRTRPEMLSRSTLEEPLDFVVLDRPEEALLLPVLEPSFQLALAVGVSLALEAAVYGAPIPRLLLESLTESEGHVLKTRCWLGLGSTEPLAVEGKVDQLPVQQGLELSQDWKRGTLQGSIGENPLRLDFQAAEDGLEVSGTLGQLSARFHITPVGEEGALDGLISSGEVGGVAYHVQSKFREDGSLEIEGRLGAARLEREASAEGTLTEGSLELLVTGNGRNGAQQVESSTHLRAVWPIP